MLWFVLLQSSLRSHGLMNINHVQPYLFKHTLGRGLISFSACLCALFSNYEQMSAAMVELLNHHKSSCHPLANRPAYAHWHTRTCSLKLKTAFLCAHALKARLNASMHAHTHTTPSHFLPSFLCTVSQFCSRHAFIVIASGLSYKCSIIHCSSKRKKNSQYEKTKLKKSE